MSEGNKTSADAPTDDQKPTNKKRTSAKRKTAASGKGGTENTKDPTSLENSGVPGSGETLTSLSVSQNETLETSSVAAPERPQEEATTPATGADPNPVVVASIDEAANDKIDPASVATNPTDPEIDIDDIQTRPADNPETISTAAVSLKETAEAPSSAVQAAPPSRHRALYWGAGAIAAALLVGVLSYRLINAPDSQATDVSKLYSVPNASTLVARTPVDERTQSQNGGATTETRQIPDNLPRAEPNRRMLSANPRQRTTETATYIGVTATPENAILSDSTNNADWGSAAVQFMNPLAYLRVAGYVMSSMLQTWGFTAPTAE